MSSFHMAIQASQASDVLRTLTNRLLDTFISEMDKDELRDTIRTKLINPILRLLYTEMYPYIFALILTIFLILMFSLLTFVLFVISLLPKRGII